MNLQRDLIERWQKRDEEKGFGKLPSAEYRRHAKVFTLLIARCDGNDVLAKRAIDAYFDDDHPMRKVDGWGIGFFQKNYQGYINRVIEADKRAASHARRWQEEKVEKDERTMPMPKAATMPPEALARTEALRRRMMGGA